MNCKAILIAACATALLGFTTARAAVEIRIDLQVDGTGASNGGTWNVLSSKSATVNLLDLNGNASGVSMTYTIDGFGVGTGLWTGGNLDWMSTAAGDDYLGTNTPGSVSFTGLGTSAWMLEVVSANTTNNMGSNFSVGGATADRTFTGDPVQTPWPGTSGQANWLIWDALAPSAGSLDLDYSTSSSYFGINAIRLTQVPEPGAYAALFAAAALGLALWRRRVTK